MIGTTWEPMSLLRVSAVKARTKTIVVEILVADEYAMLGRHGVALGGVAAVGDQDAAQLVAGRDDVLHVDHEAGKVVVEDPLAQARARSRLRDIVQTRFESGVAPWSGVRGQEEAESVDDDREQ